jgi:ubiquinone/menaquinone biosynthesis C-methylase UbiE
VKPDPNVIFEGSIPENYDRYLGPALFEPFAKNIVARLKGERARNVLEIACGTGILTRRLRNSLPPAARLVATDLNPGMLAFARAKFSTTENLDWQEADAGALPFPDNSFDAVVCQFGLMFVPDKAAAMRECYRVLGPGGVFLFNVWDSIERNPIGQTAHKTIASFFESDPPNFYELPFGFYEADVIRACYKEQVSNQLRHRSSRYRAAVHQRRTWRLVWCEEILCQRQSKSAASRWKMSYGRSPKKSPNATARLPSKARCRRLFGALFMNDFVKECCRISPQRFIERHAI